MDTQKIMGMVAGVGIGYTCGAVLFFRYQLIINKIIAAITLIIWLIYAFKYLP